MGDSILLDVDNSEEPLQAFFRKRARDRGEQLAERREARVIVMSKVSALRLQHAETRQVQMHAGDPSSAPGSRQSGSRQP